MLDEDVDEDGRHVVIGVVCALCSCHWNCHSKPENEKGSIPPRPWQSTHSISFRSSPVRLIVSYPVPSLFWLPDSWPAFSISILGDAIRRWVVDGGFGLFETGTETGVTLKRDVESNAMLKRVKIPERRVAIKWFECRRWLRITSQRNGTERLARVLLAAKRIYGALVS